MKPQEKRILNYIQAHGSITQREAMNDLGIGRLSARIMDLKEHGINIITIMEDGKNRFGDRTRYARYYIE